MLFAAHPSLDQHSGQSGVAGVAARGHQRHAQVLEGRREEAERQLAGYAPPRPAGNVGREVLERIRNDSSVL